MVSSKAATVKQYLEELPDERRVVISAVRDVILKNLPKGYEETMNWGMICYEIPLSRYPDTYNKQPLGCAALAAQKNYYAVYLSALYCDPNDKSKEEWLRKEFEKAGKKLDCGKCCVRFKRLEDLPLDVIGTAIRSVTPDEYIQMYEETRKGAAVGKRKIN